MINLSYLELGEDELTIYDYVAYLNAYLETYHEAYLEPNQNQVSFLKSLN